jgi:hypothetical protein
MAQHRSAQRSTFGPFRISTHDGAGHSRRPDTQQIERLAQMSKLINDDDIKTLLVPLLAHGKPASLRVLDWLAVNYSKKNAVVYTVIDPKTKNEEFFNLHESYLRYLRNYRRKGFDVFRRGARVFFDHDGTEIETTTAQLNFFVWMIRYNVMDWICQHKNEVETDMNSTLSNARQQRAAGTRRKRSQLVQAPSRVRISTKVRRIVFEEQI